MASEVKSLAAQTAKATEEIGQHITAMQGAMDSSVEAIGGIGAIVGEINEIATVIASAVEEQGAATQEIADNVQQASTSSREVSANIGGVTQAAEQSGTTASDMLSASTQHSEQSRVLAHEVDEFLARVRAA